MEVTSTRFKVGFALCSGLLLLALMPFFVAQAHQEPQPIYRTFQTDAPPQVSVTVYNQGTALVQDRRTFELQEGLNEIYFTDVASQIDATSVNFKSITDPTGTLVLEQNYRFDLVGSDALLRRYVDERIRVVTNDGTVYEGTLLNGSNDIILRDDEDQVIVLRQAYVRDIEFPDLPEGLLTRPTLVWLIQAGQTGPQDIEVTYMTNGITWKADYNVLVRSDETTLDMTGWVTLSNTSGATYQNAQLKLVAGDLNRANTRQATTGYTVTPTPLPTAAQPGVEQREFFEYQLYEVGRNVTLQNNETKQIEFISGQNVPANIFYVYEALAAGYRSSNPITDQYYGQSSATDIRVHLEFDTGDDALDADMPAGRVRIFQKDIDGASLLIGEDRVDHTPNGETVQLYIGNAFDLVGERLQIDFEYTGSASLRESFQIKLRNRKDDQTVEIRVVEHLFRWSNWEITGSNLVYEQIGGFTIEYRIQVPPGEEEIIEYSVHYSW